MTHVILYGVAIHDALSNPKTSVEELEKMLEHGYSVLKQQGDLRAALRKLDEEIKNRGG